MKKNNIQKLELKKLFILCMLVFFNKVLKIMNKYFSILFSICMYKLVKFKTKFCRLKLKYMYLFIIYFLYHLMYMENMIQYRYLVVYFVLI